MITERILEYLKIKGITKYKFCKDLGLSNGFLDKPREISTDKYANILEYFSEINPEWLLTGKEPMLKNQNKPIAHLASIPGKGIPLVSQEAAAGFGNVSFTITEQDIKDWYVIPDFNGIDFMVRVKGSSMYPKYNSGDIIACRKLNDRNFIQWNKCHVIATREQGLLVKRLKKGSADRILAVSDNKEYDPFEIPVEEITGLALIIGVIRLE
jgi:repressor LexA